MGIGLVPGVVAAGLLCDLTQIVEAICLLFVLGVPSLLSCGTCNRLLLPLAGLGIDGDLSSNATRRPRGAVVERLRQ